MDSPNKKNSLALNIITSPLVGDLDDELFLLKTAILYGDRITFNSFRGRIIVELLGDILFPEIQSKIKLGTNKQELVDQLVFFGNLGAKKPKSPDELLDHTFQLVASLVRTNTILDHAPVLWLLEHPLDKDNLSKWLDDFNDAMLLYCIDKVFSYLAKPWQYPIFDRYVALVPKVIQGLQRRIITDREATVDEMTEELTRRGVDFDKELIEDAIAYIMQLGVSDIALAKVKQLHVAANLFSRLPTFDNANIAEIFDIRRELEKPLVRFRGVLGEFSQEIRAEPWNNDFPIEVEMLVQRRIEPAILDIEEQVRSNHYLEKLSRRLIKEPLEVAGGSAIGVMIGSLSSVSPGLVAVFGAITGGGALALEAYSDWKDKQQETEGNQLFFYYDIGHRLSKLQKKRRRT